MKNILLILIFIGCYSFSFCSNIPERDSILAKLKHVKEDSTKWKLLIKLDEYYRRNNKDSAIVICQKMVNLAEDKLPDKLAESLILLAFRYINTEQFQKSADLYYRALDIIDPKTCWDCRSRALNGLASLAWRQHDYQKSEQLFQEAIAAYTDVKDSIGMLITMFNMSAMLLENNQLDSALYYNMLSLEIAEKLKKKEYYAHLLNGLGMVYDQREEFDHATNYYRKAYDLAHEKNDLSTMGYTLNNLAYSMIKKGEPDSAIYNLDQAKIIAEEQGFKLIMIHTLSNLSNAYEQKGELSNALKYQKELYLKNDTLSQDLYNENLADMETKYETQKKEAELAQKELTISKQQNTQKNIIGGAIAALLLITGIFQYYRNRQKQKQKEAELALQAEYAEAEKLRELDQLKSTFFTNISHEFRTPLTLIKTPLQDLIKGKLKGNIQKYYRIMDRNADRLLALINQLLDLAKLESGKMQLQASKADLGKLVRAIAYSFESLAMKKEIDLKIQTPEKPLMAWFDQDKMEKILTNLLSNAFKFTPEEGKVLVSLSEKENFVRINVSDNGIGIPENQLSHVFDRFYYKSDVSDIQASSGIGLALTKELVTLHHGTIEVESGDGNGSAFTIQLPLGKAHLKSGETIENQATELDKKAPSQVLIQPTSDTALEPKKAIQTGKAILDSTPLVLVVEDNPDVRTYIHDQIGEEYKIMEAENGRIGLELAIQHIPDLIISDVMMPEMDGTELSQQLKANDKTSHIPIILLTAKAERSDKLEGLQTGADDYLVKPFDAEELRVRMENLINQRKRLQQKFGQASPFKPKDVAVTSVDESFLQNVMTSIEENMDDEDFSIEQLAATAAMSRSQLHRKIKALTGVSPSVFVRTVRLERGKQLLEQKAGNASEVAFMVGFNSSTYFAKCFKDQFGMSPSEV